MSEPDDPLPTSDNRYVVVARRYRPKSFGELVGQQHVGQALCNAIETGRVGHAYLFTGARGVGKTSTARIFAKALNDPGGPTSHPDGESDTAQAIDAGEDIDVLEIDGASNRGIDEIRSLRSNIGVRPSRSRYKIYIIDEVHMLTVQAFNALLKTLEEPPPHVKFIFCTTDPEKLPITVLSRCQRFDFSPVKSEEIMGRLREIVDAEGVAADDESLRLIARRADGSMRDSQSLLEQVISFGSGPITAATVHVMLGTADDTRLHEIANSLSRGDAAGTLMLVDRAASEGIAAGQLTEQLLGYFRDLIVVTVGCPAEMQRHTSESLHSELRALGASWGIDRLLAIVGMIDQTLVRIRHTVHGRVLLEATLVQICHLPDLQAIADVVAAMAAGGAGAIISQPARPRLASPPAAPPRPVQSDEKKNTEATLRIDAPTSAVIPPAAITSAAIPSAAITSSAVRPVEIRPVETVANLRIDQPQLSSPAPTSPVLTTAARPAGPAPLAFAGAGAVTKPSSGLSSSGPSSSGPSSSGPQTALATKPTPRIAPVSQPASLPAPVAPVSAAKSRGQRMREMETHAFVKICIDQFDGEIVRIDLPR